MKTIIAAFLAVMIVPMTAVVFSRDTQAAQDKLTKEDIDRWMMELSNWGRWGKDDQLGAINLITQAKRKQAAALVREGTSVSLARDTNKEAAPDNTSPYEHRMTITGVNNRGQFSLDSVGVSFHGYQHTHLDALCHVFHQGKMYNGVDRATATAEGCKELDVTTMRDGVQTSGILIDIPWLRGVEWLEPGTPIYPEELEAWEKKTGVAVSPGDVVLLRTGRWARRAAKGPWGPEQGAAGLHISCAKWLKDRGVAILGSDAGSDVVPSLVEGAEGVYLPLHEMAIAMLGIPIIDNADLEAVSIEARKRNRWEFLFTLAPLRVVGGTGSPANPIATF